MSDTLSEHQRDALDRYWALVAERRDLFAERTLRPLVLERHLVERYAADQGVVLGVMAVTPYAWLVNDLVVSTYHGQRFPHPYLRLIGPPEAAAAHGVVVIATVHEPGDDGDERVVLVEQERHATGQRELEFPRGFGTSGVDSPTQALAELLTESGFAGEEAVHLGTLLPDSGLTNQLVDFFHVKVSRQSAAAPEPQEAIQRVLLLPHDDVWDRIAKGLVRDGFAVQALALYDRFARSSVMAGR